MRIFAKFIFILAVMLTFLSPGHASEEQFSMQIQGKPLADVLHDLARLSGNVIVFDKAWEDLPITVRFANLTLEKAITKILTNLNHVVIFEQGNIQIKIYGTVTPDKNTNQLPVAGQYPNRTPTDGRIRPSATSSPIAARQKSDTEEAIPEEAAEAEESGRQDDENTDIKEEAAGAEESERQDDENTDTKEEAAEAEESERQDDENTDIKEEAGEQEEADEAEATPPENGKKAKSSDESDTE